MVGLTYDSTRKLNRVQKFKKTRGGDDKNMMSQYQSNGYLTILVLLCMQWQKIQMMPYKL